MPTWWSGRTSRSTPSSDGTIDRLSGLPPGAAELLGAAVDLAATVTLQPDSLVRVEDLAISGDAVALTGDVGLTLPDQGLDGKLSLRLPRLAVLEPLLEQPLWGGLKIDATIAGSVEEPDLQIAAAGRDLLLADRTIQKLALLATAQGPTSEPAGKVELTVGTSGIEATLSTLYQLRDQTLALNELALMAPRSRIDGTLAIDLERTLIDGTIKGRVQDLAGLAPLLPVPLRGAVDLDAKLRPDAAGQAVELSLAVRDLIGDFGRLRRLEADAKVTDALGKPGIEASASARDFRQNDLHVADLGLNVAGTQEQLSVRTTVEGEMLEPFDVEARAQVALGQAIQVRLEQLSGRVAGKPLRLAGTTEVTVGDTLRLSGLDLQLAGARITADATMAKEITLDAALQDLSLAELAHFGAPALNGKVNAQLQMRGPVGDPSASLDLTVSDLRAADPAFDDLPPAQLTASAKLASRRLRLDARGEGVTDKPLILTAELPVVLQLEPFAFATPDGPVAGRLDAEVQLARLADVAGLDDDRLEGLMAVGLSLAGTLQDPQVNGAIDITDGIYENGLTGTVLRAMTLHATARQQRLTIELSANDGGTGSLSGEGYVDIDPATSFPMDVKVSLSGAQLVQTNEAHATISGDLAVSGNAAAAKLGGTLTVDQAEIYLPDQVGPSVPTIEVEEVGGPANGGSGNGAGGGAGFDLGLDVTVVLPGRTFVRGRGLESEWEGRITAKGTAAKPILNGSISIKRGYFDLLDQRLDLRPRRDRVQRRTRRRTPRSISKRPPRPATSPAIIRVDGPATSPTLTLDSEPPHAAGRGVVATSVQARSQRDHAGAGGPAGRCREPVARRRSRCARPDPGRARRRHARRRRRRRKFRHHGKSRQIPDRQDLCRGRDRHPGREQPGEGRGRDPAEHLAPGRHRRGFQQRCRRQMEVRLLRARCWSMPGSGGRCIASSRGLPAQGLSGLDRFHADPDNPPPAPRSKDRASMPRIWPEDALFAFRVVGCPF